jgi:hypothetical protein
MKSNTFARFLNKLGLTRKESRSRQDKLRRDRVASRYPHLELLEDRTLLATLPATIVTNPTIMTGAGTQAFSPQIAVDPLNHLHVVEVDAVTLANQNNNIIEGQFSTDGGQTWSAIGVTGTVQGMLLDPTSFANPQAHYTQSYSPSIAFDRLHNFYVVSAQFNGTSEATATSGAIILDKFDFSGASPSSVISSKYIYQWFSTNSVNSGDPAYNPVVSVDTNSPTFMDPDTGATQTDTMANNETIGAGAMFPGTFPKAVYVAWNTHTQQRGGYGATQDQNTGISSIMVAASGDGGNSFTTQQFASDPTIGAADAHIVFDQGSISTRPGGIAGGQFGVFWTRITPIGTNSTQPPTAAPFGGIFFDKSVPDGAVPATPAAESVTYTGTGGGVASPRRPSSTPPPPTTARPPAPEPARAPTPKAISSASFSPAVWAMTSSRSIPPARP